MPIKKIQEEKNDTGFRLAGFLIIVVFAALGLLWLWMQMPTRTEKAIKNSVPTITQTQEQATNPDKAACEAARGKWVDCGNPCHGKNGEACATVCESQCLCGGADGFTCPKDLVCADYEPSQTTPNAIGVCRKQQAPSVAEEQIKEPTTPIRVKPANTMCDTRNFICVDNSVAQEALTNPFTATGSGLSFENTINYRLVDAEGNELIEGFTMAQAPDVGQPGDFSIRDFILRVPKTSKGTLEVFEYSAKDGEPIHKARISVELPTESMKTKIYLPSNTKDDCGDVTPFEIDVVRSSLPVETAMRALLEIGPSISSKQTAIPKKTRLISLKVSNGTATVVLSPELGSYGGGSCNVGAIRSQIETTLKQFNSIKNVAIIEQGKTAEETLQP